MATYNGEEYLKEQIDSILCQLSVRDELIISDDHSTDSTLEIIRSYEDDRIKIFLNNGRKGVTHNFENALLQSKGDIIFLADQDDVWFPDKIERLSSYMLQGNYDVVIGNCAMTDSKLNIIQKEYYFKQSPLEKTVWGNLFKNLWLGACMAFKREVLWAALPFPKNLVAHDIWIGLYSQWRFKCGYYPNIVQYYRRHDNTASFAGRKSTYSLLYKINYRLYLLYYLLWRNIFSSH